MNKVSRYTLLAVLSLALIAVLAGLTLTSMIGGLAEEGRAAGVRSALELAIHRAILLNDSQRANSISILKTSDRIESGEYVQRPFCDAQKLLQAKKDAMNDLPLSCVVVNAVSVAKGVGHSTRCGSLPDSKCIRLVFHSDILGNPGLRALIEDAVGNPCKYLADDATLDRLRANQKEQEFSFKSKNQIFTQTGARRDLVCDSGKPELRKVFIESAED